jgi:hypothetical protein
MPPHGSLLAHPPLTADRGRWSVPVPWAVVGTARDYLARRGCPGTLCLDAVARRAELILWPGADPGQALDLLDHLNGQPVAAARRSA